MFAATMGTQNFFSDVFGEIAHISKRGWMLFLALAAMSAISDLVHWSLGPDLTAYDWAGLILMLPVWLAVTFVTSMALISRRQEIGSFSRFAISTLVIFLPVMGGVAGILLLLPNENKTAIVTICLILFGIGLLFLTFLPAFPLAQAVSTSFVSPMSIWHATKGHRWSLILVSFATSSINKMVPSTSTASNVWQAYLLAVGNGLVGMLTAILATSLGVTAWRYAVRNNRALLGDVPQAD